MYEYAADLVRVIDGDTLVMNIDKGFRDWQIFEIRLFGVNAPEKTGLTKEAGLASEQFVLGWLDAAKALASDNFPGEFLIRTELDKSSTDKKDSFGRYLGTIFGFHPLTGTSLNRALIDSGHAVPYLVPEGYWLNHL